MLYWHRQFYVWDRDRKVLQRYRKQDVKTRFDTTGYSIDDTKSLPILKNKKLVSMMKDEINWKFMAKFVVFTTKMYAYRKVDKEFEDKYYKGKKTL